MTETRLLVSPPKVFLEEAYVHQDPYKPKLQGRSRQPELPRQQKNDTDRRAAKESRNIVTHQSEKENENLTEVRHSPNPQPGRLGSSRFGSPDYIEPFEAFTPDAKHREELRHLTVLTHRVNEAEEAFREAVAEKERYRLDAQDARREVEITLTLTLTLTRCLT